MSSHPPSWLQDIASRVDARLGEFLNSETIRWKSLDADLALPLEEINRLVSAGGKRLRPAFCYLGFIGAGGDENSAKLVDAQAALELLHASALLHDDVIDGSQTRRGEPTSHARYTKTHKDNSWASEARRFGEGAAVLIGDLAFVYADQLMDISNNDVAKIWNEMRVELNIGQYLDLLGSAQRERRLVKAERVSRYKSGKYTIERPLHLGATLAAPALTSQLLPALSKYGLPLGDAFQMRDDVLGAFDFADSDKSLTGKPVGDDLREGKPTPLLAMSFERADSVQRKVLDLVGSVDISDQDVSDIQEVIKQTGALVALEAKISALTAEAIAGIKQAPITQSARDSLIELAEFISQRTT
ncbi:MAG: geranylgeranyl pyrophosphate synthase [Actinomycetota bacterium]